MNAAALRTLEIIRSTGTQRDAVPLMQTREDLYRYLDYHAYEQKLDAMFSAGKDKGN
jgi:methylisocitrate lyase